MNLPDQAARDRFIADTENNFSVIAPAGVGKTTAIAHRILQLAKEDAAHAKGNAPRLPKLVVVTYTRKAADEMRDRARGEIVKAGLPPWVLGLFNEAFFGTIHSFCMELLRRFGPLAGLPTRFAVELDDTAMRLAFQRDTADVAAFLPEAARAAWRRYGMAEKVWTLAWSQPAGEQSLPEPGRIPLIDLQPLFNFQRAKKNKKAEENIRRSRERLRRWQEAPADARALGVPLAAGGGEDFITLWGETFQPLRQWLATAAAYAATQLARAYADFKMQQGCLSYDDFVRPTVALLRDPAIAARIRAEKFSVLLDEAQDTDPAQFAVLVGVAQPVGAPGLWLEGGGAPPMPGRFSMVGDPQQSIYERGSVRAYAELDRQLVASGAAEKLEFTVTLRCDEKIVAGVNAAFPGLLDGRNGQAQFVELQARPGAGAGNIWRLPLPRPDGLGDKPSAAVVVQAEAGALAQWLAAAGPKGAGVADWSHLAIIAPRRKWLSMLAGALRGAGLSGQLHSSENARGAKPARTWLAALLGVLADPEDDFEVAGVLREIFGISDDEIFHWRNSGGRVKTPNVDDAQTWLREASRAAAGKPVRDAVAEAVETIGLRERLAAIGANPNELTALLDQAVLADAHGDSLAAFAQQIRVEPAGAAELVAQPGHIQLLTSHKAKGLEWQTVVLFGLFVRPDFPPPEYPCWMPPSGPGQPPVCLYDKFQAAATGEGENSPATNRARERRAAFERLLYVSMTRPRHHLILTDASALAVESKLSNGSLAEVLHMQESGPAGEWWNSLPVLGQKMPKPKNLADKIEPRSETAVAADWPRPNWPKEIFAQAEAWAKKFPHRVLPSSLAHHAVVKPPERTEPDLYAPPDYPEEQPLPNVAVDYGNWWHQLMEHTPWAMGLAAWTTYWEQNWAGAPDPMRAKAEIQHLQKSPLMQQFLEPGWTFATELTFLWADESGETAYDGCVDFAAWNAQESRWLVIDWKTDQTKSNAEVELRDRYGAQVCVYARALQALTGATAVAFIYGTRTGAVIAL
jgi:ATP-dependent exoDNAse (exonuclease V) beta subunit